VAGDLLVSIGEIVLVCNANVRLGDWLHEAVADRKARVSGDMIVRRLSAADEREGEQMWPEFRGSYQTVFHRDEPGWGLRAAGSPSSLAFFDVAL
jgi:hypothetical protein